MLKELAYRLAEGGTAYAKAKSTNEIFKANGGGWDMPFAPSTIAQLGLAEYIKSNCSERETLLITAYTLLEGCHRELHITIATMKETPKPASLTNLKMCYAALAYFGLEYLLLDGLDIKKYKKYLI